MKEKSEFSERIKKARAQKCRLYASVIKAAGIGEIKTDCPECGKEITIKIPNKQWQAIAWLAERTEVEEFGAKIRHQHGGEDGQPIKHVIEVVYSD